MSSSRPNINKDDKRAVYDDVDDMYVEGEPFWTKERLLDFGQKLARVRNQARGVQETVTSIGIDGSEAEYNVISPMIVPAGRGEAHDTVHIPTIKYINFQTLMMDIAEDFWPETSYHNLRLAHRQIGYLTPEGTIPTYELRTHAEVEAVLKDDKLEWDDTPACRRLKMVLEPATIPSGITKIVGFGLGSVADTWADEEEEVRLHHISAYQHALLLTLREIIGKKQGNTEDIKCYVQDPAYKDADRSALAGVGIIVLDDPNGFIEVDDDTVVVSCCPSVCVKQIITDLAQPAMIFWEEEDAEEDEDDRADFLDPYCHRVSALQRNYYHKLRFPGDEEHFGMLAMYLRSCD